MRLALAAIMRDESDLVQRWMQNALGFPALFDEVVVVVDSDSTDSTAEMLRAAGIPVHARPLTGSFADQRNYCLDHTTADWIFELDADEIASVPLLCGLRQIAANAEAAGVDCVGIPRLNFHDHVLQLGAGYRGLDFQYRLHQRHCRWHGAVHKEITGYAARIELALGDGHLIQHVKSAVRHAERNALYARMDP